MTGTFVRNVHRDSTNTYYQAMHVVHDVPVINIQGLQNAGCSEEEIFEAVAVTSLFNYMNRMADALGAPVEGFQHMVADMMKDQS